MIRLLLAAFPPRPAKAGATAREGNLILAYYFEKLIIQNIYFYK
jgi:hypothetical protein